jgi:SanA protein
MRIFRRILSILRRRWRIALPFGVLLAICPIFCDLGIGLAARGRVHSDVGDVPEAPVALLLGTAKLHYGRPNLFYGPRIESAAELFKTGKVRGILVSGDNGRVGYSEPEDMRDDLVAAGVPARFITLDYAGFRTLDSLVRAKEIFGQTKIIIVSQKFHVERALFLADRFGIEASAYVAADPTSRRYYVKTRAREILARAAAVADILIGRDPKFGGPKEVVALKAEVGPGG